MGGDRRPRALSLLLLLLAATLVAGNAAGGQADHRHPPPFPAAVEEEVAEVESDVQVAQVRRSLQVEVEPLHGGAAHGHKHDDHEHDHDHNDHEHEHEHEHDAHAGHAHGHAKAATEPGSSGHVQRFSLAVWSEALFATALVGAAPVVVLLFVPLGVGNQEAQQPLLRVFLSFAAGGLLGDALLHLLPHSLPEGAAHAHDHAHGHDHGAEGHSHSLADLSMWLWTLAGMLTFLMLEKFVRAQTNGGHGHSHGHSHGSAVVQNDGASVSNPRSLDGSTARKRKGESKTTPSTAELHEEASSPQPPTKQPIAAAGYLNLAADFTHNFTDGLAIGATFLRGSGWQTTLAMLLHELPHEIGDFAILIQSGFTRREAMLTQLLTAVGAMAGTVVGLLMEGAGDSSSVWISPFTAGGFIYIACASVMPELLDDCSLAQSLKEGAAMCVGIGLMALIALSE